jgi:protein ImuB
VFGVLFAAAGSPPADVQSVAREFSPRIEVLGAREVALDLSGVARLFGDARTIAEELRRTAADRGLRVRVAIAVTRMAARLLVRHRAGITIAGDDTAAAVAPLPIALLAAVTGVLNDPNAPNAPHDPNAPNDPNDPNVRTLRRWGIRTLGEFAVLPAADVAARLGQEGLDWQRLARGEDPRPLVPAAVEERFEQALDLEWPIDGLEPLSFVFGRLMEPLEAQLARRDRGAAVLHVRLHLVDKTVHERSLQLPAPIRDARALRTLALLDLESHPPAAAVDRVIVAIDPTPGRIVQFSLLTRALPSPERLSTLLARLGAVMGEGRCGSPALVDTWTPGAFALTPFAPIDRIQPPDEEAGNRNAPILALRRFRTPVPARVRIEDGTPVRVFIDRPVGGGGRVETAAGPWRTSGNWWHEAAPVRHDDGPVRRRSGGDRNPLRQSEGGWDRDEWDVALADGVTYRVFRERDTGAWFVAGVVD